MKLKQYSKHALVVVALSATTIFAATAWPNISGVQDGQVIQANTLHDSLQYLYERSWDFLGGDETFIATNLSVAAPRYCDENGENCFTAADVGNSTTTIVSGNRVMCEVTFDYATTGRNGTVIRYIDQGGTAAVGAWSKNDKPNFDPRWNNTILYSKWGGSIIDSASRAAVGFYDADQYNAQYAWISQGHEPTLSVATFEAEEGGNATVTNTRKGTHTVSASVGVCEPMVRPPVFSWNRTAWSSCTEPLRYNEIFVPAEKGTPAHTQRFPVLPTDQTRSVSCRNQSGETVDDAYCPADKPASQQACYRCTGKALEMGACL